MSSNEERVAVVLVTYKPDRHSLLCNLKRALGQVDKVIVIDNGSPAEVFDGVAGLPGLYLKRLTKNEGIAFAQNMGVEIARRFGYGWILFLDQDSRLSDDCVSALRAAYSSLSCEKNRIAAVGAMYFNQMSNESGAFVRLRGLMLEQCRPDPESSPQCVDYLISSGMLTRTAVLDSIGDFEEDFFIDWVDTEWCMRARAAGWLLYGVPQARLSHELGSGALQLPGRRVPLHAPARHYFVYRNFVVLCRRSYISRSEKLALIIRMTLRFMLYMALGDQRFSRLRAIMTGLVDGWQGNLGRGNRGLDL